MRPRGRPEPDQCSPARAGRIGGRRANGRRVSFSGAMGLLDDAIREHLELKRRRGADPREVARAEREALDSPGASPAPDAQAAVAPDSPFPEAPELGESVASSSPEEVQETEELDMKPLLEDEPVAIPDDRDPAGDFMGAAG